METLQQRKEKFRKHMEQAKSYEKEGDLSDALKEYRKALPYSLHKHDSEHLKKKIQDMQDMMQYVTGMPEHQRGGGVNKLFLLGSGIILLVVLAIVMFLVIKP